MLPGCFSSHSSPDTTYTYFIQLLTDSKILISIKKDITPLINSIIKEELGLKKDFEFDFFIPKKPTPSYLTLYYVVDMPESGTPVVASALVGIEKNLQDSTPHHALLVPKVAFFGDDKDELVMLVSDPKEELLKLNTTIKEVIHEAHKQYKGKQHASLYDVTKSEKFPYLPHIGLGRIRTNSIRQHIKDTTHVATTFEQIRQRIIKEVLSVAEKMLSTETAKLHFDKIRFVNLKKSLEIKVIALED